MPNRPMKRRDYERWIRQYGWSLQKAGMDWKLVDENGNLKVRNIIITHPGGEVIPLSIKKTEQALKGAGH
jgi:hypothetical protein